ncbi:MAG: hypothetical protein ACSHXD_19190 [Marinosulfonomonas sp.]
MKITILLCLIGFSAASKVSAQESAFRVGAVIANDAALVLQNGADETLIPGILLDLNRLRQAAETDNTGMAARAYFETIDRVDVDALRKLLTSKVDTSNIRANGALGNHCVEEFRRRVSRLPGFEFEEWSRGKIPETERASRGIHFVLFGKTPLVRIVSKSAALPTLPEGVSLREEMFVPKGAGFQIWLGFRSEDIMASGGLIQEDDKIIGIVSDVADPDFGLGTLEIQDYSYCLLPPTP